MFKRWIWLSTLCLLPLAAVGAETQAPKGPSREESPATASATRQMVRDALQDHAAAKEVSHRDRATRRLVDVLVTLKSDRTLPREERISLHGQVRSRLMDVQRRLKAVIARHAEEAKKLKLGPAAAPPKDGRPASVSVPAKRDGLGQVIPGGNARPGGAAIGGAQVGASQQIDLGQELVELIQKVIATPTWDVNGGPSSIVYYRNFHALVVRAPAEVHGEIGNVLGQLRK